MIHNDKRLDKLNDKFFLILVNEFPQDVWEMAFYTENIWYAKEKKMVSKLFLNVQGVSKHRGKLSKVHKEFIDKLSTFIKNRFGLDLYKVTRDYESYAIYRYGPITEDMIDAWI